jgi:hypothetical protein
MENIVRFRPGVTESFAFGPATACCVDLPSGEVDGGALTADIPGSSSGQDATL